MKLYYTGPGVACIVYLPAVAQAFSVLAAQRHAGEDMQAQPPFEHRSAACRTDGLTGARARCGGRGWARLRAGSRR